MFTAPLTFGKLGGLGFSWLFSPNKTEKTMRTNTLTTATPLSLPTRQPLIESSLSCVLPVQPPATDSSEVIRHILVGTPKAVRQTINLLHALNYAEAVLWTPVLRIQEPVVITPQQGEAMSLLRKMV